MPVLVAKAVKEDVPIYLDGVGSSQALSTVTLRTRVDGQLVKLAFKEGQEVHEGDLLAVIDPRPYDVQLAQAKGQAAQAQGQLAQAKGQTAQAKGQAAQAQGQLDQAQGQMARDRAALENAQRDLDRYTKAQDAVPRQQLDTARTQVDQAKAAVQIDEATIKSANAAIQVAEAANKQAEAAIESANASIQVAEASIKSAELMLTYTQITAPISGRIGIRNVDLGNIVHASDAAGMAVITQIQPITVVFTLQQDKLPAVLQAMRETPQVPTLVFDTFDSTFNHPLATGTVLALDNQIDMASGTFKIKAVFDNKDEALYPNQLVNVRLLVDTKRSAVVVPSQAVQRSPQSTYLDVIKPDLTVEQRTVTPGPTEGGRTIIVQGLLEGEMVATAGLDRLDNGTKVTLQGADTQAAAGPPPGRGAGSRPATGSGRAGRGGTGAATSQAEGG